MSDITESTQAAQSSRFVRGVDVLPPELLEHVQRHVDGRLVYVPARATTERRERDDQIVRLHAEGRRAQELAARFGISERRVHQVLRRERAGAQGAA